MQLYELIINLVQLFGWFDSQKLYFEKPRLDSRCSVWCIGVKSAWVGQSLILQVAKKASVLKRRKSRNRMDVPTNVPHQLEPTSTAMVTSTQQSGKYDLDTEVVCYTEEPRAGKSTHFKHFQDK